MTEETWKKLSAMHGAQSAAPAICPACGKFEDRHAPDCWEQRAKRIRADFAAAMPTLSAPPPSPRRCQACGILLADGRMVQCVLCDRAQLAARVNRHAPTRGFRNANALDVADADVVLSHVRSPVVGCRFEIRSIHDELLTWGAHHPVPLEIPVSALIEWARAHFCVPIGVRISTGVLEPCAVKR